MERNLNFLIIDDNVIDILICKLLIKNISPSAKIIYFTDAREGMGFIQENYPLASDPETILILDINMPLMSGWEFLEEFEKLKAQIKKRIRIWVVSFYGSAQTEEKANQIPNVGVVLSKPLTKEKILSALNIHKASGCEIKIS